MTRNMEHMKYIMVIQTREIPRFFSQTRYHTAFSDDMNDIRESFYDALNNLMDYTDWQPDPEDCNMDEEEWEAINDLAEVEDPDEDFLKNVSVDIGEMSLYTACFASGKDIAAEVIEFLKGNFDVQLADIDQENSEDQDGEPTYSEKIIAAAEQNPDDYNAVSKLVDLLDECIGRVEEDEY